MLQQTTAETIDNLLIISHIVTVYENSPQKTLKALKQILGEEGINQLFHLMLDCVVDGIRRN